MGTVLKPVRNRALSDDVYEALRDAIFSGRLQPGDPLREMHLAKELSVSQATVRDALVKLERFGLVVRVPNKETVVTRHTKREIRERIAVRATLEEKAFLDAASRMTAEDCEALEGKLQRISSSFRRKEYFDAASFDLDFHRYVWRRSGNELLAEMLDQLTMPLFAFISILRSTGASKLKDLVAPHEDLIESLKSKNQARIKKVLHEHIIGSYADFLNSEAESLEEMLKQ
ncbi:MAG: GntR family transcriptional regulator [Blastocatellia bacterium]|nr:GntR family transcriptional regulator [Blastocatellia bacterium]MBO0800211.1 GntR family transcriptional regulator [Blastocatellia bacterium]